MSIFSLRRLVVAFGAVVLAIACHRSPAAEASVPPAARTVFTDSVLHAERCAPVKPTEDWRRVCTPLDQSAPRPRRAP